MKFNMTTKDVEVEETGSFQEVCEKINKAIRDNFGRIPRMYYTNKKGELIVEFNCPEYIVAWEEEIKTLLRGIQ